MAEPAGSRSEPFSYAILRVVPDLERGECVNAGVVLHCATLGFVGARVHLDEARLEALSQGLAPGPVREHLAALVRIAAGDGEAGPIAALPPGQRFGWLTAPTSTVVQPSVVHTGLCDDPAAALDELFERLVTTSP